MSTSKQAPKKELLGKGISALLKNINEDYKSTNGGLKSEVVTQATGITRIAIDQIQANPKNPRKDFDEQALNELATSIKIHDIIQPLTVSKLPSGKYQLIAGERRFRASKIAGLKDVPAYVRQTNDQQLLELALLENLQREDLNAIEIGLSYKRMMDELTYTQEQVADRMGKERSTVTNYIRLLKLPPDIQLAVRQNKLSMGHARAIIGLDLVDKQLHVFKEVVDKGLSVRQTEELIKKSFKENATATKTAIAKNVLPPAYKRIEDNLASHFATKVRLNHSQKGSGSITVEYYSLQELNKILEQMNVKVS